jgi:hypothetical protein
MIANFAKKYKTKAIHGLPLKKIKLDDHLHFTNPWIDFVKQKCSSNDQHRFPIGFSNFQHV